MIEKLLENWLDSASERSYQAVFVQMLAAEGYTVLHSTRHCTLEYGKDVLAIAPDGVGCVFQLKGDPGGRMTVSAFRNGIQQQLFQLMTQTPSFPGFPAGNYRGYLVSNGQFDEEVQVAVSQMNSNPAAAKVDLWARGTLLSLSRKHATFLWPSELKSNRALLEIYLSDARGPLLVPQLADVLGAVLSLSSDDSAALGEGALKRAASSASWLTGVVLANYAEAENHHAVASGWALCCVMLIGAAERHAGGENGAVQQSLELAGAAVVDNLVGLWSEVRHADSLIVGNPLHDLEIHGWRVGVLRCLLSALAIADNRKAVLDDVSRQDLHRWLMDDSRKTLLWGEGAIADLLPWLIWWRKSDPTGRPHRRIANLASSIICFNLPRSERALANPYYSFEDVARHYSGLGATHAGKGLREETFAGRSFTAEVLLHLLVRLDLKQACMVLWPSFTKLAHARLGFDHLWQYCKIRIEDGVDETYLPPPSYEWTALRRDALESPSTSRVPLELRARPWLLALWWHLAPNRLNSDSARVLADTLLPNWSIASAGRS